MVEQEIKWEWTDSTVEMIPFGLLAGFYGEKEIRITKLAEDGFCFRSVEKFCSLEKSFRLCFYDLKQGRYREIPVMPAAWRTEQKTEFFVSYAVAVQQEDYRKAVRMLFGQYDRYIRLKLAEDDGGLAEQMTGYPAKEDEIFADSFREQMDAWFGNGKNRENCEGTEQAETWKYAVMEPALALELDHPSVYTQFLKQSIDEFLADYQERYPVFQDWFRERKVERIYIGNAFCHLLFPEETTLFSMLDKAYKLGLKITVTFSYVREYQLKHMEKLLKKLEDGECSRIMVVATGALLSPVAVAQKGTIPCIAHAIVYERSDVK